MDLETKAGRKNAQLVEEVQVSVLIGKICRFSGPRLITWYYPPSMSGLRGLAAERNVKGCRQDYSRGTTIGGLRLCLVLYRGVVLNFSFGISSATESGKGGRLRRYRRRFGLKRRRRTTLKSARATYRGGWAE
jgi:hypothetical protein